jgi:hypothetical protein
MNKKIFVRIGDERIKLSSIKRYFPTKFSNSNKFGITICLSVQKSGDKYIFPCKTFEEQEETLNILDNLFGIA